MRLETQRVLLIIETGDSITIGVTIPVKFANFHTFIVNIYSIIQVDPYSTIPAVCSPLLKSHSSNTKTILPLHTVFVEFYLCKDTHTN